VFESLQTLGLKLGASALGALPVVAEWLVLSMALEWTQERRAAHLGTVAAQGD
jgi:ATP:ADP antiporter, AAA family